MMAEPTAPGRGLPVYQPATDHEDGTCSAPPEARPSVISWVFTPINGMVSETGLATGAACADCGGAAAGRGGAGAAPPRAAPARGAGVEWRVSSSPAVPATITTRPTAKTIAAG